MYHRVEFLAHFILLFCHVLQANSKLNSVECVKKSNFDIFFCLFFENRVIKFHFQKYLSYFYG